MNTTDLAGRRLSVYDIEDALEQMWNQSGKSNAVLTFAPTMHETLASLIAPKTEIAKVRGLRFRYGEIAVHESPFIPDGQMLLMDASRFADWYKAMERAVLITNIGVTNE